LKVTLAVLIDALSWETLRQSDLLAGRRACCKPITTILGYSSAAVPSILTGRLPQEHGRWSYLYYDPAHSPFRWTRIFRLGGPLIDNRFVDNPLLKRYVARWTARRNGFDGYFPVYDYPLRYLPLIDHCSKRWDFLPGAFECPSLVDILREHRVPAEFLTYPMPEEEVFVRCAAGLARRATRLYFLYLSSVDALGHAGGPAAPALFDRLRWYDARLRELLALAEAGGHAVDLFLFSDHGMVPTTQTSDLKRRIEALPLRFGRDYVAFYDSTMARFYHLTPASRPAIESLLRAEPVGRILADEEKRRYGIAFAGERFGQTIFLLPAGTVLHPSHMARRVLKAMHGFDPDDHRNDGVFLSTVPPARPPSAITDLLGVLLDSADVLEHEERESPAKNAKGHAEDGTSSFRVALSRFSRSFRVFRAPNGRSASEDASLLAPPQSAPAEFASSDANGSHHAGRSASEDASLLGAGSRP